MNDALIWIYDDCLDPQSLALQQNLNRPAMYVFDEELLQNISLKRIAFVYECLLEIPAIQIRTGSVAEELIAAMEENNCQRIVTITSVAPHFKQIVAALRQRNIEVEILPAPTFVNLSSIEAQQIDLKRFSRYWQQVKRQAMSLNESLF
jgi:hypothetical protein